MSAAETDVQVVFCTAPGGRVAADLARALVEEKLAACVNLVTSVRSIYAWQGGIREDDEVLLVIKTRRDLCSALSDRIQALHPYDVPEVVVLPVVGGSADYLDWVRSECAS